MRAELPTLWYWGNIFLENKKVINWKLGNFGNIILSLLISQFSILSYSQEILDLKNSLIYEISQIFEFSA